MKSEVLRLLSNVISSKWNRFGTYLDIKTDVLNGIQQDQPDAFARFCCVVQYWLDKSDESDCTWETLISVLINLEHGDAVFIVKDFLGLKLAAEGSKILKQVAKIICVTGKTEKSSTDKQPKANQKPSNQKPATTNQKPAEHQIQESMKH